MTNAQQQVQPRRTKTGLKTAGMMFKLAATVPGLLFRANRAYKGFELSFIQAALPQGMPEELARELVNPLKPMKMLGDMRKTSKAADRKKVHMQQ